MQHYNREMVETAKRLRREATEAERRLWELLCQRRCGGHRFLRQVPAGHFVLDFYCPKARLAIEVDGSIHQEKNVAARDVERETVLREEMKIAILRLSNDEILSLEPDELSQRIQEAVAQAESIAPSPGGRPARLR